jgi:ribonuclease HI
MSTQVVMYTDGACRGNPGPGGWGVVLIYQNNRKTLRGFAAETTNNRMELTAVIEGLRALNRSCRVEINTDSKYVMQGINEWIANWKRNGWKTAARKPVKNFDLWQQLDEEVASLPASRVTSWPINSRTRQSMRRYRHETDRTGYGNHGA